jgi:hypothetical protein
MGTTLTGTTPQDTYDSLIKVTDNGPLSATGKYLSDGLGNDSVLALSTSRVGIGVAAPTHLVQIYAASLPELRLGDASAQIQMYTNTTDGVFGTVGASPLVFRTNATERMRITSAGKFGIGTTTTPYKFNVYDTSDAIVGHFSGGASNYTLVSFLSNEPNVYSTSLGSYNSGLLFRTSAADRMYINSSGNVGIGTTSPAAKIQVAGNNGSAIAYLYNNSGAAGQVNGLNVEAGTNSSDYALSVASSLGTSYLRVRGDGNVGIGTTSPVAKLSVVDSVNSYCGLFDGAGGTSFVALGTTGGGPSIAGYTANFAATTNLLLNPDGGNVGIGTSSPESKLHVAGGNIRVGTALDNTTYSIGKATAGAETFRGAVQFASNTTTDNVAFITHETGVFSGEVARFTGTQYLRFASGSGGIQFNGDTAAANALDDYEEGTWTMGISFGGGSTGITYSNNTGTYTKIGRKVTVNGYMSLTNRGSSTGAAAITGLPFTISLGNTYYSAASLAFFNISFANQYQAYGQVYSTQIFLEEVTEAGVGSSLTDSDFANNSALMVSLTYFV